MSIEELRNILETIPKTGVINKARRRAIQAQIIALMEEQNINE